MKSLVLSAAVLLSCCLFVSAQSNPADFDCPSVGYMFPDADNLCFVWFCEGVGQEPIKRACPKGARVPTWWEGGVLNMCFQVNIEKHGGHNICLRCDTVDELIDDSCASGNNPCPADCDCVDIEYTHRCDCPFTAGGLGGFVPPPEDFCDPDPCINGGTCQNQWDGFFCFCTASWTGDRCELAICDWDPCLNGGTCVVDEVGYHCLCTECWGGACCNETRPGSNCPDETEPPTCDECRTGRNCEFVINSCRCIDCGDGVCVDGPDGVECRAVTCGPCEYLDGIGVCRDITGLCECNNPCDSGQKCRDGDSVSDSVTCEDANPSSGESFTIMFEENNTEKSIREIPLELYLSPATPDTGVRLVNIKSGALEPGHHCYFNENITVPENDVYRFEIQRCMRHNGTGLDNLGIQITELDEKLIVVYGINKDRFTADGFLAIPDDAAGTDFQTASYAPAHIATQFGIAAMSDNTRVTIELADDNDLPAPYNTRGSTYELTMNAYQTFQVQARCRSTGANPISRQCPLDLSGSRIKSDKPIHVFSGNVRAFIIAGRARSRDHLVEELIPTEEWGMKFGLVSVPGRTVGDLLNIMAVRGTPTTIRLYQINQDNQQSMQVFTLPQDGRVNMYKEIPSGGRFYIESDQKISVTLLTKSKTPNEQYHDPASITIPPVEQFTNNFFISTPSFTGGESFNPQPYNTNLVMLVARKGEERFITLNGQALEGRFIEEWADLPQPAGNSEAPELVGCSVRLNHGTSLLKNTEGFDFQCLVYGFDDRETYGFPVATNHMHIHGPDEL